MGLLENPPLRIVLNIFAYRGTYRKNKLKGFPSLLGQRKLENYEFYIDR